ncbi:hypothetical protein CASFOL_000254 [Castilleja foliolosa]|uniref:DUF1995 domain-containing protein n=1 Tax=Castilleja foliolosa TaxID=1961234 RepID=A0ABD3EN72_9LAMI
MDLLKVGLLQLLMGVVGTHPLDLIKVCMQLQGEASAASPNAAVRNVRSALLSSHHPRKFGASQTLGGDVDGDDDDVTWNLGKMMSNQLRCVLALLGGKGGEMASATYPIPASSITRLPSISHFPSSLYPSKACAFNGIPRFRFIYRTLAKFDKFQGQDNLEEDDVSQQEVEDVEEDDSCLPSDLEGAVCQSGQATAEFVSSGGMRAIVELLIPQLRFLDDEGAQAELWELSKIFLDTLIEETGGLRVKAIFPDAGAAALLKYQWKDAAFGFSSLGDRKPVTSEDEIVVMVVPDYQMLGYVEKIASELSDDPPRPLIMWNPRLISEDVGVGINVRRLRRDFLSTYTIVYSMKPLPSGAVFRCYPGLWKVFYDDKERPNRYLLAKELIRRPDTEELEIIFGEQDSPEKKSLLDQAIGVFSSFNRFMKVISR